MSKRASEKNIGETKNQKFKKELTIDEEKAEIVNEIIDDLLDGCRLHRQRHNVICRHISTYFRQI